VPTLTPSGYVPPAEELAPGFGHAGQILSLLSGKLEPPRAPPPLGEGRGREGDNPAIKVSVISVPKGSG